MFYSNVVCVLDEDETHTVAIRSDLMGKSIVLDPKVIAKHLGLENKGEDNEKAIVYLN